MKNLFLYLFLATSLFTTAQRKTSKSTNNYTEKGFFITLKTGYNLGTQAELATSYNNNNPLNIFQENAKVYYAQGAVVAIGAGYQFNKFVSTHLDFDYLFSSSFTYTETSTGGFIDPEKTIKSKSIQIKPSVVFTLGYNKIDPYLKFGAIIAKQSFTETLNDPSKITISRQQKTDLYDGGLSFGFTAGFGSTYAITNKIKIFGELVYNSISFSPKTKVTESYTIDGVNQLQTLDTRDITTNFSDSFTGSITSDPNKPRQQTSFTKNFSSLGLSFGVQYSF